MNTKLKWKACKKHTSAQWHHVNKPSTKQYTSLKNLSVIHVIFAMTSEVAKLFALGWSINASWAVPTFCRSPEQIKNMVSTITLKKLDCQDIYLRHYIRALYDVTIFNETLAGKSPWCIQTLYSITITFPAFLWTIQVTPNSEKMKT